MMRWKSLMYYILKTIASIGSVVGFGFLITEGPSVVSGLIWNVVASLLWIMDLYKNQTK